jgi:oxygen-independent coproporphyrinogen-3 oxidase
VEEKTALAHQVKSGKVTLLEEEEVNGQFLLLHQNLTSRGFHHYEISNYAIPGYEAKHNSSYWTGASYLGIGPGAHSFDGKKRWWNIANNRAYEKELRSGGRWYEGEDLSEKDRFNEMIMTSLRNDKGLDLANLQKRFPELFNDEILLTADHWTQEGWATIKNNTINLTIQGWLISDNLASELFIL